MKFYLCFVRFGGIGQGAQLRERERRYKSIGGHTSHVTKSQVGITRKRKLLFRTSYPRSRKHRNKEDEPDSVPDRVSGPTRDGLRT